MESGHCLIGVSFGNTNSVIACTLPDGRTEVLADKEGDRIIPCVVSYMKDEIFHGNEAKKRISISPDSTFQNLYDLLGNPSRRLDIKNHMLYIKIAAEYLFGKSVDGCIVAVPYGLDNEQKVSLEGILKESGFELTQIISEPVASLLGYVMNEPQPLKQLVLVLECGGTKCSVSLVHAVHGKYGVLSSSQTDAISGQHLDRILCDYLLGIFEKEKGTVLSGTKALAKLVQEAEQARVTLSSSTKATISVDGIMGDIDFHTSVSRLRTDMLFRQFYKDFIEFFTRVIKLNGFQLSHIDSVVLSGGLTNTPKILSIVEKLFPKANVLRPSASYDKSSFALEACARGAAAQASILSSIPFDETLTYLEVVAEPLAVYKESLVLKSNQGRYFVLVKENSIQNDTYFLTISLAANENTLALFQGRKILKPESSEAIEEDEEEEGESSDSADSAWDVTIRILEANLNYIPEGATVEAKIQKMGEKLEFSISYDRMILGRATVC